MNFLRVSNCSYQGQSKPKTPGRGRPMCLPYIKPRVDPDFRQNDQLWASAKLKIKEIAITSTEHRGSVNQHLEYLVEEIGQTHRSAPTAPHT